MMPEMECVETIVVTVVAAIIVMTNRDMFFETRHVGRLLETRYGIDPHSNSQSVFLKCLKRILETHSKKTHAVVVVTVMGLSFAVVQLFAFDLLRHRREGPGCPLIAVELLAGLLAQPFLRDELLHSFIPPLRLVPTFDNTAWHYIWPGPPGSGCPASG